MRVSLLGPLQVDGAPGAVVLGAAKERSLLAALALNPGVVVSSESLIGALWGDDPPATARKTLQTYVWNLRQALGADVIVTEPPGYALRVVPDDIDVGRFRRLVREGEAAMRAGLPSRASDLLGEATSLWRGEAFSGVAAHTGLAAEAVRLHEERLSALEARVKADLQAGRHAAIVGELESLVREHRFRERLWGYLMTALYRCGRQADALAAYQRVRELLRDELGLEPGGELQRIEAAVLRHDPDLAAPTATHRSSPSPILRSPVRYARSSDGAGIAYEVAGSGPTDILAIPGFVSHLDIWWNAPTDRLVRSLTSLGRLIAFDKRGMGLSDRPEVVDVDDWVDDACAVLDAVGSQRPIVLGVAGGSVTALTLAARHPERVRALILYAGYARHLAAPGYDAGHDLHEAESFAHNLEARWGAGGSISFFAPSRAAEPGVRAYWARYQQLSASPKAALRFYWTLMNADVRDLLPSISVPTLLVHADRDLAVPLPQARYIADRIPGAELVTFSSDVHLMCLSDVIDDMAVEMDAFIRRVTSDPDATDVEPALVTAMAVCVDGRRRAEVESVVERCGGTLQGPETTVIFDAPGRAVRCASMLVREVGAIGIGMHAGECFPTVDGHRGSAVEVAHRLAREARPTEVLLTGTVRDLVASRDLDVVCREPLLSDLGLEVVSLRHL